MFYEYDYGVLNLNLVETFCKVRSNNSNSITFLINNHYYVKTFNTSEERDSEFIRLKQKLCNF